jgi:glycosyltransferase involved in cell wall biosynthesis
MNTLTLVVPCYNEAERLRPEPYRQALADYPELHLLFVNDGSRDGTLQVLQSYAAADPGRIAVLDVQPNQGKAEAVRRGVIAAFGAGRPLVGFWDADLATPFSQLRDFLEVLRTRPQTDLVLGSRVKLLGRHIDRKTSRHYIGRVLATGAATVLGLAVYDTQCGAKLFRANDDLRAVFDRPFTTRWIFDVEMIARYIDGAGPARVVERAERIYELPLREWVDEPGSKVRTKDGVRAIADLVRLYWLRRRGALLPSGGRPTSA